MTAWPSSAGECVLCSKIGTCLETSVGKVLTGHTCHFFSLEQEALVHARGFMMDRYGAVTAARAMLGQREHKEEELPTMQWTDPPPLGTTVSQRRVMFDQMGFPNVRHLGAVVYKCLLWEESLAPEGREPCKQKVLEFELANNIISPDPAVPTNQGALSMSQPFQPGVVPPPQPMPTQPAAMPQMPGVPQPPPFASPPPPAMPPQLAPPPPPAMQMPQVPQVVPGVPSAPPQADPTPPPTGKGKGKSKGAAAGAAGAAAAPPPPPPPVMTGMPPPPMAGPVPTAVPQAPMAAAPQWVPGQFAPPQAPVQPTFQPPQPSATPGVPAAQVAQMAVPQQLDLGPLVANIDAVGKALNAVSETLGLKLAALAHNQELILVALYHIYASDPSLAAAAKANKWDLSGVEKFVEHLGNNLPR